VLGDWKSVLEDLVSRAYFQDNTDLIVCIMILVRQGLRITKYKYSCFRPEKHINHNHFSRLLNAVEIFCSTSLAFIGKNAHVF